MNIHTKQQQDKVFETDFIDSQKSDPPFVHLLALSINISVGRMADIWNMLVKRWYPKP